MQTVAQNPVFELNYLKHIARSSLPPPLDGLNVFWFAYARYALFLALRAMGAKPGQMVLLPSLICNVIMAPLNALKLQPVFYSLTSDLHVDLESVQKLFSKGCVALLAVNYCGFPQKLLALQDFCREKGIWFIEDNVQGLFSSDGKQPLGIFGDVSLFSIRKSIAVPNGAALVVNNPNIADGLSAENQEFTKWHLPARYVARNLYRFAQRHTPCRFGTRGESRFNINGLRDNDHSLEFDVASYSGAISSTSLFLLRALDAKQQKQTRRKAFLFWLDYFKSEQPKGVDTIYRRLPDGISPFGFPFWGAKSEQMLRRLRSCGIEAYPWPHFPDHPLLKGAEQIVIIPTHALP